MNEAADWLAKRAAEAPAALREWMLEAVDGMATREAGERQPDASPAERAEPASAPELPEPDVERSARILADAALDRLRGVIASDGDRASARVLLTADALLSHSCERAAERGSDALDRMTRAYGPTRFAALLDGAEAGRP